MKLSKVNNIYPDKRTYKPSDALILNRRDVGIEIEVEGLRNRRDPPAFWRFENDGSLRNNGIELISEIIRGEDITQALANAEAFCLENGLVHSDRTSVHVHLDVRHLDTEELIFLTTMYVIFEKFFFMKSGDPERELNNHCRPIQTSTALYSAISNLFSARRDRVFRSLHNWPKYTALNLKPVLSQGSIEFRHHVGTHSADEILEWINIIFSLSNYVRKNKDNDLQSEIDKVCYDGQGLFSVVFPKYKGEFTDELHQTMLEGARYIQLPINDRPTETDVEEEVFQHLDEFTGAGRRGVTVGDRLRATRSTIWSTNPVPDDTRRG